jgi:hypothetical protein
MKSRIPPIPPIPNPIELPLFLKAAYSVHPHFLEARSTKSWMISIREVEEIIATLAAEVDKLKAIQ